MKEREEEKEIEVQRKRRSSMREDSGSCEWEWNSFLFLRSSFSIFDPRPFLLSSSVLLLLRLLRPFLYHPYVKSVYTYYAKRITVGGLARQTRRARCVINTDALVVLLDLCHSPATFSFLSLPPASLVLSSTEHETRCYEYQINATPVTPSR